MPDAETLTFESGLNPLKNGAVFRPAPLARKHKSGSSLNPLKNGAVFRQHARLHHPEEARLNPLKNGAVFRQERNGRCLSILPSQSPEERGGLPTPPWRKLSRLLTCLNPLKNGAVFRLLVDADFRGADLVSIP